MKVLFDQGTPVPLRRALYGHEVKTAYELGWSSLQNGALIASAEAAGFEVFVTTDRNLKYQQNLADRSLDIVVLLTTSWPRIQRAVDQISEVVGQAKAGSYFEVLVPGAG